MARRKKETGLDAFVRVAEQTARPLSVKKTRESERLMGIPAYTVGMIVEHPTRPDWGPGKVLAVEHERITVYWRDLRESKAGDAVKVMNINAIPLSVAASQSDPWLDHLPRFENGGLRMTKRRLTFAEALDLFLARFPNGFKDPKYLDDRKFQERAYKWRAHQAFEEMLGNGKGERLLAAGDIDGLVHAAQHVVCMVNLLSPYEQMALHDALADKDAARSFFTGLFALLSASKPSAETFEPYAAAVRNLPAEEDRARVATWPVLTILPFLAQPDRHMLLKPSVTEKAAERLAFNLNYRPELNWLTYERLLVMSGLLFDKLKPYGVRDFIDVQSFMWITGRQHATD
jgi:hypothetical protein